MEEVFGDATVAKSYGGASAPAFATMSRKDAPAAIAIAANAGAAVDRAATQQLLNGLRDLDPANLSDNSFNR